MRTPSRLFLMRLLSLNATVFPFGAGARATPAASTQQDPTKTQRHLAIEDLVSAFESRFAVKNLSANEIMDADGLPKERFVLVDVRSHGERLVSKIPRSLSWDEFRSGVQTKDFTNKTVVFYCTIGYRSSVLAQRLADDRFQSANLRGGLLRWIHEGGAITDRFNQATKTVHVYGSKWNILPQGFVPTF
jgi:rhodanese-related sulfurtransferase